jgi:hypothetical protein
MTSKYDLFVQYGLEWPVERPHGGTGDRRNDGGHQEETEYLAVSPERMIHPIDHADKPASLYWPRGRGPHGQAVGGSVMAIDLAGLWDSGLLLFYLSIAVVLALDVAVMVWASRAVYPKDSPAPRLDAPASKPQPVDAPQRREAVTSYAGLPAAAP